MAGEANFFTASEVFQEEYFKSTAETPANSIFEKYGDPLLLEIWINNNTRQVMIPVIDSNEGFLVKPDDLTAAGIKSAESDVDGDGFIDIKKLEGVNVQYSGSEQKLMITTDDAHLLPQLFDLKTGQRKQIDETGIGFIGQYDMSGMVDDFSKTGKTTSLGSALSGTIFSPYGNFSSNGFTQTQNGDSRIIRLDSFYEMDNPDNMQKLIIGDSISGTQNWSRAVRFAGLKLSTDFSLRPDLNTMPLPAFFGKSAVPASVDVFVNSARVFETNIEPGPFQINNLPIITGGGEVSYVIRDVLGRESTVTMPFFANNSLLREGLSSYDIDIGVLREGYGVDNFTYGKPVMMGTYNLGINDWLTLKTHSELTLDTQLAGGGAAFSIGPFGVLNMASAFSRSEAYEDKKPGMLHSFSFETQFRPVGLVGSMTLANDRYADVASENASPQPKLQMQLGMNVNLGDYGSVAASVIEQQKENEEKARFITASYSTQLARNINLGTTGFYDYNNQTLVTEVFISIQLNSNTTGNASIHSSRNSREQQVGVTRSADPDGGFGYRVSASAGDSRNKQGDVTWIGEKINLGGGLSSRKGVDAGRVNATGGIVIMDGSLYTTRRPDNAVALVSTGQSGTKIYKENRLVATAGEDGKALVPGLVPFIGNNISIDPESYDFSTIVEDTEKNITPRNNSGVYVQFTPALRNPFLVTIELADKSYPPLGSLVTFKNSSENLVVGNHGEIFITDLKEVMEGVIENKSLKCNFSVTPPIARISDEIPRIGPVLCAQ